MGVLKKMVANDLKKNLVAEWKKERRRIQEEAIKNEYGKHGNAVELRTQNPTKTQIKKFIERYKKARANLNKNK